MGLWELMASGGLPALAKLSVRLGGVFWGGPNELKTRVAPALDAVAGTLTHLHLDNASAGWCCTDGVGSGYELGVAAGKLRRLKDLALDLFRDGRAYHAFAQGLAASGGDRPLPVLWRVTVSSQVQVDADLVASLLLPSVRVFISSYYFSDHEAMLLTACALRLKGYKHVWAFKPPGKAEAAARAIAQCPYGLVHGNDCPWIAHRPV
jgi:hypothetical protein